MTAAPAVQDDDYFPDNGDLSYDVRHYDLRIRYQVDSNQLDGRAVLEAVALTDLDELHLDLRGLSVRKVSMDAATVSKFSTKGGKLVVRTRKLIRAGQKFRLSVSYGGRPAPIPDGDDEMGWEELDDGVIVAGQTNGAPSWFPCNDRPSNKASYRLAFTVPTSYYVAANGTRTHRHRGASSTSWVYEQPEPMATYLATVQIGRYVERKITSAPVPMRAVMPQRLVGDYDRAFGRQPEMLEFFARLFGPYPFASYGVVITADELEIPLEAQGLSIFGSNFLTDDWDAVRLVAHELSHQWFGNSLTLTTWRDIWLHEGFACYAEWLWSEESGQKSAHERAVDHWNGLADKAEDLELGDPGPDDMFDDRVYKRGAILLHALRLDLGDDMFFGLLSTWVARNAHGSVTTRMFIDLAEELSGQELGEFFDRWLWKTELPELPAGS